MKKNFEKYKFADEAIGEKIIDILANETEMEIAEKLLDKKNKLHKHTYQYKPFIRDNTYSFVNFSYCTGEKNNPMSVSNYEQVAFNSPRLIVPKLFMQAFSTLEAVYLAELARLSLYKPVNDYGFYSTSKYEIMRDIGLTAKQQDRLCKKLENRGLIDTVTFRKQMRKFYRFNDDVVLEEYWKCLKKTFVNVKYREE